MTTTLPAPAGPARRRPLGPSFGPLPLSCVVVVEVGLAVAVVVVALDRALLPVAGLLLSVALLVGLLRHRGRWVVQWIALGVRFRLRERQRRAEPVGADTDPRLRALRLVAGDVVVARGRDHDGREVGLVGHEGVWSAVLTIDAGERAGSGLVVGAGPDGGATGAATFPLAALAPTLSDRGVVLDAVTALWHCRPGGAGLPPDSPALAAYREVLGPLPPVARRDAHLVVRLDPLRCPAAVAERGGGVVGAHRALLGALARIERVLSEHDTTMRPLDADEVLRTATDVAGLRDHAAADDLRLQEHWGAVVLGAAGHATFAVTGWPPEGTALTALTGVCAQATTLAITLGPGVDDPGDSGDPGAAAVAVRAAVRVAAATPGGLEEAGAELVGLAHAAGIGLDPLDGQHAEGLVATLPLGAGP